MLHPGITITATGMRQRKSNYTLGQVAFRRVKGISITNPSLRPIKNRNFLTT